MGKGALCSGRILGQHGSPRKGITYTWDTTPLTLGTTWGVNYFQLSEVGPGPVTPSGPLPEGFLCCGPATAHGHNGVCISVPQVCRTGRVHPFLHIRHPPLLPGPEVHPWLGQPLHPWVRLWGPMGWSPTGKTRGWAAGAEEAV